MKSIVLISFFMASTLCAQLSKFSDRELYQMGKVWGLMKYYHPAVSQGKTDWDGVLLESFRSGPKEGVEGIVKNWMTKADQQKFDKITEKNNECDSITLRNFDASWVNKLKISPENKTRLTKLANQPADVGSFYSNTAKSGIYFSSANEKVYESFSKAVKMLDLFRIWNAVEYFYPYKYLLDHQWDEVLKKYIPLFRKINNEKDYESAVMQLAAELQDTHVGIEKTYQYNVVGKLSSPFTFQIVENKVLITGIKDETKMKKASLEVGDLITKINGQSILKNIPKKSKYFAFSNKSVELREAYSYLFSGDEETIAVEGIHKNGEKFRTTVERTKRIFDDEWDKDGIPDLHLVYKGKNYNYLTYNEKESRLNPSFPIDDKVYFEFSSLKGAEIPSLMEQYKNTKGMVFDLRGYNNNGSLLKVFDYLLANTVLYGIKTQPNFSQPGKFCFVDNIVNKEYKFAGKENPDPYKGQVVVLINEHTVSAEEMWAMVFKKVPNVIFVGSQTAGADGNKTSIKLTDGNKIIFSGLGIYYPDGGETQRIGIKPDVVVRPTIQSTRNKEDLLLLKALELIDQKK
ncbi:S41 family peptidase [uncultured Chryseobacterium sp.]|uniref:S41 family peptidase n=1 Tax=uncultured Chryseobacterium sp. TaxID=259322 RepID=UPI0025F28445|nr:S41 family peptidase [uncultured Chryseobacterium sp.]